MYLCHNRLTQLHSFSFLRLKTEHLVVDFLVENNSVNVVKQTEQMSLREKQRERRENTAGIRKILKEHLYEEKARRKGPR